MATNTELLLNYVKYHKHIKVDYLWEKRVFSTGPTDRPKTFFAPGAGTVNPPAVDALDD